MPRSPGLEGREGLENTTSKLMQIQNTNPIFSNTGRARTRVSTYYFHVLLVLLVPAGVRRGLTAGERTNAPRAGAGRWRRAASRKDHRRRRALARDC
jgi:hypothetical protein